MPTEPQASMGGQDREKKEKRGAHFGGGGYAWAGKIRNSVLNANQEKAMSAERPHKNYTPKDIEGVFRCRFPQWGRLRTPRAFHCDRIGCDKWGGGEDKLVVFVN